MRRGGGEHRQWKVGRKRRQQQRRQRQRRQQEGSVLCVCLCDKRSNAQTRRRKLIAHDFTDPPRLPLTIAFDSDFDFCSWSCAWERGRRIMGRQISGGRRLLYP